MTDQGLGTATPSTVLSIPTLNSRVATPWRPFSRDWHWAVLLVFLNLLLFADALFTDKTFFFRDVSFFHYPLKKLVTEAYARGNWPLWNPFIQLGQPLLANPNTMALYPTQILFHVFPFELAFELHFVVHCMVAGVATFYLARTLEFCSFSAFIAAVIYNFSGVTLSFVNLFNILPVVAFLPLLTLASIRILRSPTIGRLLAGTLVVGGFGLLLEPLSSLAIAVFLLLFVTAYFLFSGKSRLKPISALGYLALVVVSGMLLAAIQILPTLELIRHSGRRGGLDFQIISGWSLHPVNLLQLVFPRVFGDYFRLTPNSSWAGIYFERREPYLLSCYFGGFSLLLAWVGFFFSDRRWMSRALAATALVGLLLALGKYGLVYPLLYDSCPLFRYGRYPVKYLLIFNFALSILSGYGIQRILNLRETSEWRKSWRRPWAVTAIVLIGFGFVASFIAEKLLGQAGSGSAVYRLQALGAELNLPFEIITSSLQSLELQLGAVVIFLVFSWLGNVHVKILKFSAALLLLFDFGIHNYWINPLIRHELYETAPAAAYLQKQMHERGSFRVFELESDESHEKALTFGRTDSIAWSYLQRKQALSHFLAAKDHISYAAVQPIDLLETLPSQRIHAELAATRSPEEKLRFLAGLNVEYILALHDIDSPLVVLDSTFAINSTQPLHLYRLQNSLPRAFLTKSLGPADDTQGFREQLSVRGDTAAAASSDWARILDYQPNRIEIETESSENQLLVLLDSYYPGWHASIDTVQTPVIAANFIYRAINLPRGHHRVIFRYEPESFVYGAAVSGCTALLWGIVWVVSLGRRSARATRTRGRM